MSTLPWETEFVVAHTEILLRSHRQFTGRDLMMDVGDARAQARVALRSAIRGRVARNGGDPVLNYGNATALELWQMSWEELTCTPSRFTAEAPERDQRARLLAAVTANGFIDDYSGVRISKSGTALPHRARDSVESRGRRRETIRPGGDVPGVDVAVNAVCGIQVDSRRAPH